MRRRFSSSVIRGSYSSRRGDCPGRPSRRGFAVALWLLAAPPAFALDPAPFDSAARRGREAFVREYLVPALDYLEGGRLREAELYRAAHFLMYAPALGFPPDDPLVARARRYFLSTRGPDGMWPWSYECGCLLPKTVSGLLETGTPPDDPGVRRSIETWTAWALRTWKGKGWGECYAPLLIEGFRPGEKSLVTTHCTPEAILEQSMKSAHALALAGRGDLLARALERAPSDPEGWGIDLSQRPYQVEHLGWVLFTQEALERDGGGLSEGLVSASADRLLWAADHLDRLPDVAKSPYLLGALLRGVLRAEGGLGPRGEAVARLLLQTQKGDGRWVFYGGGGMWGTWPRPKGSLDGSATIVASVALAEAARAATASPRLLPFPLPPTPPELALAPPRVEQFVYRTVLEEMDRLRRTPPEAIDRAVRIEHAWPIHTAYYDLLHVMMFRRALGPWADPVAREAESLFREIVRGNAGAIPAFDFQCLGMKSLHALGSMGATRTDPIVARELPRLLDLRVEGGWLQLEYTHALDPRGVPWRPEVEKSAKGVAALLALGFAPGAPEVAGALAAMEQAAGEHRYEAGFPLDWAIGVGWAMLAEEATGIRSLPLHRLLRGELIRMALGERAPEFQSPYLMGIALLALKGVLPEASPPWRAALRKIALAYDPATGSFGSPARFFHPDFPRSARHSMKPLLALEGHGRDLLVGGIPPGAPLPPPTYDRKTGTIRVRWVGGAPLLEWTDDGFRTFVSRPMTGGGPDWRGEAGAGGPGAIALHVVFPGPDGWREGGWVRLSRAGGGEVVSPRSAWTPPGVDWRVVLFAVGGLLVLLALPILFLRARRGGRG